MQRVLSFGGNAYGGGSGRQLTISANTNLYHFIVYSHIPNILPETTSCTA